MSSQDFPSKAIFRIGMGLNDADLYCGTDSKQVEISHLTTRRTTSTMAPKVSKGCSFPSKDFFLSGLGLLSNDEISSSHDFQFDCDVQRANEFAEKVRVAKDIVKWAVSKYGSALVMSTSFGLQSAVLLHLVTSVQHDIPTLWVCTCSKPNAIPHSHTFYQVDTGYLPVETYKYAHYLKESLQLNLKICQSELSPAHMEALYGKLWESPDPNDRRLYGVLRKVIPMKNMLLQLSAKCMLAGLRKTQTDHRSNLRSYEMPQFTADQHECAKLYPLLNWTKEDIAQYFVEHNLPQHPLYYKGYTTVGDAHSSRPKSAADKSDRDTRFGSSGQQECGLHTETGSVADFKSIAAKSVKLSINEMIAVSVEVPEPNIPLTVTQTMEIILATSTASKFVVIGRVNCRFCKAAKLLLTSMGEAFEEVLLRKPEEEPPAAPTRFVELSIMMEVVILARMLKGMNRDNSPYEVKTVPQIFHRGEHVGGYTELCVFVGESAEGQNYFLGTVEKQLDNDVRKQPAEKNDRGREASTKSVMQVRVSRDDSSNQGQK